MGFCEEPSLPGQSNKLKEYMWDTATKVTDNMLQTCGQGLNIIWISAMPTGMATLKPTKADRSQKKKENFESFP
jgi:hypothetical protein